MIRDFMPVTVESEGQEECLSRDMWQFYSIIMRNTYNPYSLKNSYSN